MQKPIGAPMMVFFIAFITLLCAALYDFRLLPSLRSDTLLIHGVIYPTAWWAHRYALFLAITSILFIVAGSVGLLTLNESRRRYIANLPRWQQWFFWPFHGVTFQVPPLPPV